MSHNNRKRKHRSAHTNRADSSIPHQQSSSGAPEFQFLDHHEDYQQAHKVSEGLQDVLDPLRMLYIQAHEADIVHSHGAEEVAQTLEVVEYRVGDDNTVQLVPKIGSALIRWGGSHATTNESHALDGQEKDLVPGIVQEQDSRSAVWVDRYDARLLLDIDSLPPSLTSVNETDPTPASPSGWSDLPSDSEDTFFLTPDEVEDLHREKRRRLLERTREERLKARLEEDGIDEELKDEDIWGGSDEEPDETQKELMQRTAAHLISSPNPAQLEMRILANHGGDRRFAFLRGRWKNSWSLAKAKVRLEKAKAEQARIAEKSHPKPVGLGIVASYGSDLDDSNAEDDEQDEARKPGPSNDKEIITRPANLASPTPNPVNESAKEAKRKRLREWTERRRAEKDGAK